MSFSGGVYTLPGPALVTGEVVSATENNQFRNDVAGAFNLTVLRNGTSTATANLPMGGYKLTGLGAPTANGDALSYGAAAVVTTLTSTSLTATRVPYAGTGGLLQDASTFTFDGTTLTAGGFSTAGNIAAATASISGNVTYTGGTANGVAYLNGSKVLTTGTDLVFTSTGLGIGTSSPSYKLDVRGAGLVGNFEGSTYGQIQIKATGTNQNAYLTLNPNGTGKGVIQYGATDVMTLDSSGRVGIGTSSPATKLHVAGDSSMEVRFTSSGDLTTGAAAFLRFGGSNSATSGYVGFGGTASTLDLVNALNGPIRFSANGAERMRIDSSGNVGIGTSSPATKLHVAGATRVQDSSNSANYMTFGVGANAPYGNASISTTTAGLAIVAEGAGNMTFLNNGSERMRIDSSGNLLVGTTTPSQNVGASGLTLYNNSNAGRIDFGKTVSGSAYASVFYYSGTSVGSITYSNTATAFNTSSDYRLKENIQPMQNALARNALLKPCTYSWKADGSTGEGFIAHELQAVCPGAVTGEKDAVDKDGKPVYQGVDTSFLVGHLVACIQELKAELDATKAEVAALKNTAA